jgi:hypothetical protein
LLLLAQFPDGPRHDVLSRPHFQKQSIFCCASILRSLSADILAEHWH